MMPSMRKVRIFCCDPDATDSSDDEDDQDLKKEKKVISEVLVPVKKYKTSKPLKTLVSCGTKDLKGPAKHEPSSKYRGVRLRPSGRWAAEIRNPVTKKRKWIGTYSTEEEASVAYQAYAKQCRAEALVMKAQLRVSERSALCSLSSVSCVSLSLSCKQELQEAQNGVGLPVDVNPEPMDESLLNFSPAPNEISEDALLDQVDGLPVSDLSSPAHELPLYDFPVSDFLSPPQELPLDDFTWLEDVFPISDFIGATYVAQDDDYIGMADNSHLRFPITDPGLNLDAELDLSEFDFALTEHEL